MATSSVSGRYSIASKPGKLPEPSKTARRSPPVVPFHEKTSPSWKLRIFSKKGLGTFRSEGAISEISHRATVSPRQELLFIEGTLYEHHFIFISVYRGVSFLNDGIPLRNPQVL